MKNGRFYVWMALLVASTFIIISTTKDATADPFKRLAPIKGYSQVFSLTGPVISEKGGVSAKSTEAALAGLEMLEKGGNAVDAVVASGLASTVTSGGARTIAGYGGNMVIYLKQLGGCRGEDRDRGKDARRRSDCEAEGSGATPIIVDFNSRAPINLNASLFPSVAATNDATNVLTVLPWSPVAGLYTALKNYGTMTWKEVMQPAIRLAENGYVLSVSNAADFNSNCAAGRKFALSPASKEIYCPATPYKAGDLFIQKDLANSLRILAREGPDAIYTGSLGQKMVDYLQSIGSVITKKDFIDWRDRYIKIYKPAQTNYRGYDVYTSPIETGGEAVINILNLLNGFDLGTSPSAPAIHLMMESVKVAFTDRFYWVTDPYFVEVPYFGLTSQGYANQRRTLISPFIVAPAYPVGNPWPFDNNLGPDFYLEKKHPFDAEDTHPNTTSTSTVDQDGNMVAMTFTVNSGYGSGITVPGTGITLNDGLTGNKFSLDPSSRNYLEGGKLILNNMNPFLILKDGNAIVSGGAAGGRTILDSCVQTIVQLINFHKDIFHAMNAPRFHCEATESSCSFEKTYDPTILSQLIRMGHSSVTTTSIGAQHGLTFDPNTGLSTMSLDLRDDRSTAAGFQKK
jgi:gamma-glutamyltranspeptidase/glutathione hydrolase